MPLVSRGKICCVFINVYHGDHHLPVVCRGRQYKPLFLIEQPIWKRTSWLEATANPKMLHAYHALAWEPGKSWTILMPKWIKVGQKKSLNSTVPGWWFQPTPLKNIIISQLGWCTSQLNGTIIQMFQTTNQIRSSCHTCWACLWEEKPTGIMGFWLFWLWKYHGTRNDAQTCFNWLV